VLKLRAPSARANATARTTARNLTRMSSARAVQVHAGLPEQRVGGVFQCPDRRPESGAVSSGVPPGIALCPAFPSWFRRIECDRCAKLTMLTRRTWSFRTYSRLSKRRHGYAGYKRPPRKEFRW
jgi:hypothetical protein